MIVSIKNYFIQENRMRGLSYILFVLCILFGESITSRAYSEAIQTFNEESSLIGTKEETEKETKEIRIRKDEFDEIVNQLQGMKVLLEDMKQEYDTRLTVMQEKIATLEKEKAKLEKTQKEKMDEPATAQMNPNVSKVSMIHEEEKSVPVQTPTQGGVSTISSSPLPIEKGYISPMEEIPAPQTNTKTVSPSPSQQTAEPIFPPMDTTGMGQPVPPGTGQWSPTQPITLMRMGQNYMNISFDGLFSAAVSTAEDLEGIETGAHDPIQRGFTVQNLETAFEGAVDPYFKGNAFLIFQIDKEGESFLEVEEAYLTSMSLPLNLQVKAGTFFTEFGRLNPTHPHAWDFADQPLVVGRFLSADGMRNPGARLSWLAPTNNYTELFFTVQDSQGETVRSFRNEDGLFGREAVETRVRSMEDMLYIPRVATSFDLTEEQTILLGASAAFGPNSTGRDKNTLIYGLDMFWKWKSKYAAGGFPFITWQTEVMARRFEAGEDVDAGLSDEVINNWGAYSQVAWGFKKRWVTGLRGDYVDGEAEATDPLGFERWRLSPNLTFYPSEFSKIRLQYNYDDTIGNDSTEHSVFLQFEFLLGAHAAHKF
jgi:hypothetical protein